MGNVEQNKRINYTCTASNKRLFSGENNELIFIKLYKGDWGDWDEKTSENKIFQTPSDNTSSAVSNSGGIDNY